MYDKIKLSVLKQANLRTNVPRWKFNQVRFKINDFLAGGDRQNIRHNSKKTPFYMKRPFI